MNSTIEIDLKRGIYVPELIKIRVKSELGSVYCLINDAIVLFNTITAHKAGFALILKASQAIQGEFVEMKVNNQPIQLLPEHAKRVGTALLRKADDADDFQILNRG